MELPILYQQYLQALRTRLVQEGFTQDDMADILSHELVDDAARIESLNQEMRSFKAVWTEGQTEPGYWPDDNLIIGESGSGDYYCISRSGSYPGVVQFEHEMAMFTPYSDSLEEFYLAVIQLMQPRKERYDLG